MGRGQGSTGKNLSPILVVFCCMTNKAAFACKHAIVIKPEHIRIWRAVCTVA